MDAGFEGSLLIWLYRLPQKLSTIQCILFDVRFFFYMYFWSCKLYDIICSALGQPMWMFPCIFAGYVMTKGLVWACSYVGLGNRLCLTRNKELEMPLRKTALRIIRIRNIGSYCVLFNSFVKLKKYTAKWNKTHTSESLNY